MRVCIRLHGPVPAPPPARARAPWVAVFAFGVLPCCDNTHTHTHAHTRTHTHTHTHATHVRQGCSLEALELLYTRAAGLVVAAAARADRGSVLQELEAALEALLLPAAGAGAGAAGAAVAGGGGVNARGMHR